MDCLACLEPVPSDGRFLTCMECNSSYHLGTCAGISDNTFKSMGSGKREKWQCKTCRHKDARSHSVCSAEASQATSGGSTALDEVNKKLDMLLSIKASVEKLLPLPAKVDELLSLKPAMAELKVQVNELQASVDFCSSQYDTVLQTVTNNEARIEQLGGELAATKEVVLEQSNTIHQLQSDLNDMQTLLCKSTLEINGIPSSQIENLGLVVNNLAERLDLPPLQQADVSELCRLPSKKGVTAPILVIFASIDVRDRWMACRSRLRALPSPDALSKVFFNERLSRVGRELFWKARVKGKANNYKFVWVKYGKIYAKKSENMDTIRINSVQDLEKIC